MSTLTKFLIEEIQTAPEFVVVPLPFTDLTSAKVQPALILASLIRVSAVKLNQVREQVCAVIREV